VVMLVLMLVQKGGATFKEIDKGQLPSDASAPLATWISSNNIPVEDSDTSAAFYEITLAGALGRAYVADYSGDDPDLFRATVIIQSGQVIGESLQVAS
jgi:hypothetical protein